MNRRDMMLQAIAGACALAIPLAVPEAGLRKIYRIETVGGRFRILNRVLMSDLRPGDEFLMFEDGQALNGRKYRAEKDPYCVDEKWGIEALSEPIGRHLGPISQHLG